MDCDTDTLAMSPVTGTVVPPSLPSPPPSFSDFATEITDLLKSLLKVDAQQRLDFADFFARVEALTKNNIQVIDALSGATSRMRMSHVSR